MKTGTESKLKFKKLQRLLGLPLWQATGVLESLWQCTVRNAPSGDIGRLSNEDVAFAIEWERDADELINALVECGWLDLCDKHRLVVHNWRIHCPDFVKRRNSKRSPTPTLAFENWRSVPDSREKYQAYLCSREWNARRVAIHQRAGGVCERCRQSPIESVHHLTYERKYEEKLEDLQGLCSQCHDFVHGRTGENPAE